MGDKRENCEGEEKMRATERKVRVWYVYVLKKKEKGNPYILLSVFVICNNIIDGLKSVIGSISCAIIVIGGNNPSLM